MPHSELHQKKLKKNLVVLALVAFWCALLFCITIIRMSGGAETQVPEQNQSLTRQEQSYER